MRLFLTLALLAQVWAGSAQVYFNQQIDWEHEYEYLSGVVVFGDSNNILTTGGHNDLTTTYIDHFLLSQLSKTGEIVWERSFLPVSNATGNASNLVKIDNDFSMMHGNAAVVNPSGTYNSQIFLFKIRNNTGEVIFSKEYGEGDIENVGSRLTSTQDGGFALVGWSFPANNSSKPKIVLLKTDSLGNAQFRKEYTTDATKDHYAYSLVQANDGGYLLYGTRGYFATPPGVITEVHNLDMVLIKTDASGNKQWQKVYPPWEWQQNLIVGFDLQVLSDGKFLISAGKGYALFQPGNTFSAQYFFGKLDASGEFIDSTTLPDWHELCRINRLKSSSDGNFWAVGAEKDSSNLGQTGLIMKISPELEVLWKREYRVSPPESLLHEMFYDATEMPDHGFVLCGGAFGPLEDSTNANGWVIRVDSLGCLEPGCNISIAVNDPPANAQEDAVAISPNPTDGRARIAVQGAVLLGVRLLDLQGKIINDVQFLRAAAWQACDLDLSGQPPGVYIAQVRTTKGWSVHKICRI